jgi:anhydro-N-acetylmuramic acid kinase
MRRLTELARGVEVETTTALGLDPDAKEAIAFALIGWATLHGISGNVPSCTGASGPRVLGRVTPGTDGVLPGLRAVMPQRLILQDREPR